MRVLHVTDGYRPRLGGIEVFVEDLAGRQARAGHEVAVLTAEPDRPTGPAAAPPVDRVRVVRAPRTLRHPLAGPLARETALVGGYDVVHAHLSVLSPFATTVARLADEAGIATVHTVHSMWASRRPVLRAVRSAADWDRSTAAWTAVSGAAAADVRALLAPGVPVSVVPNAVDVAWWRRGPARSAIGTDAVTVVSVMRIAGRKRPFALLHMLAALRAQLPPKVGLRALIVGDGPLTARVRAELDRSGLAGWVTLLGGRTREEIRAIYATADVYVAPAYEESFGIAALEARAAGLPVVAMRTGGVGEFIEDGIEGFLCQDDAEMTAALALLCGRPDVRRGIARGNTARPPLQDWPVVVAAYDGIYRRAHEEKEALRHATADEQTSGRLRRQARR